MKAYYAICIKDDKLIAQNGDTQEIKRGMEYTVSKPEDGTLTVFSRYWCPFPADRFAGFLTLERKEIPNGEWP